MELGTIQAPAVIHEDKARGYRVLAWKQAIALLPGFEPIHQMVVTGENLDADPLEGGWMVDSLLELRRDEAAAVRGAIDAFLGSIPDCEVDHNAKHWFVEGDRSLLIEPIYDVSGDVYPLVGWELSDEHGEAIRITPTRLMWLATIAPQLLAAYNAAQRSEEVGNA